MTVVSMCPARLRLRVVGRPIENRSARRFDLCIVLMTEAYPENATYSVGAILPVLLAGDVFAVAWFRRNADWRQLCGCCPGCSWA